jgi:hypothetical protein
MIDKMFRQADIIGDAFRWCWERGEDRRGSNE